MAVDNLSPVTVKKPRATAPVVDSRPIRVRPIPHMPREVIAYLQGEFPKTRCFLEYGSGGSTRLAARLGVETIFSVESDKAFGAAVRAHIEGHPQESGAALHMIIPDIGETKAWGFPVSVERARDWPRYPTDVWDLMKAEGKSPDLILVDGRFRVACWLISMLNAKPGTRIIFDDYRERVDRYGIAETFVPITQMLARSALFIVPEELPVAEMTLALARHTMQTW